VLDFAFIVGSAVLCATCTLVLERLATANDRRGAGGAIDAVSGDPGSTLVLRDALRLRPACVGTDYALAQLLLNPAVPGLPSSQSGRAVDASFRGADYPGSYLAADAALTTTRIPTARGGFTVFTGGYNMVRGRPQTLPRRLRQAARVQTRGPSPTHDRPPSPGTV
jgi:hypothetical protein